MEILDQRSATKLLVGNDSLVFLKEFLSDSGNIRCLVVMDEEVKDNCFPIFSESVFGGANIDHFIVPSGEASKSIDSAVHIWKHLIASHYGRKDLIINLGGGMITDLGAFSASLYKRGIDFINVPTTLLGMVDAAYGGKTAVNLSDIKNQIGNYSWPVAVLIYGKFLETLHEREVKCGFAEMLKAGLIADIDLWNRLSNMNPGVLPVEEIIQQSLNVKIDIVSEDPFEAGERKLLNFGHTFGHAFEAIGNSSPAGIHHGEAVALGLLFESYLSYKIMAMPFIELVKIRDVVYEHYKHVDFDEIDPHNLINLMKHDKKNVAGINFTLLSAIGRGVIDNIVDEDNILEALDWCKTNYNSNIIAG